MKEKHVKHFDRTKYGPMLTVPGIISDTYLFKHDGPPVCKTCVIGLECVQQLPIGTARFIVPKEPGRPAELRVLNTSCEWIPPTESTTVEGLWKTLYKESGRGEQEMKDFLKKGVVVPANWI